MSSADVLHVLIDGQEYALPTLWLKLNDPGSITANGQRKFEIADIVNNPLAAVASECNCASGLSVKWDDGTHSQYSPAWLERHVTNPQQQLAPHLWNGRFRRFLPEVDGKELLHSSSLGKRPYGETPCAAVASKARLRLCSLLTRYGVVIVRSVPVEEGMVAQVGNAIGHVRTTNYGSIFDVIDHGEQARNLADTSVRINAHLDNPYRDPYPGVQLLHCLKQAPHGGATRLTDGFAAAEALRRVDPEAFRLLACSRHPWEYRDVLSGVLLQTRTPVLTLDERGHVERVCYNNRSAGCMPLASMSPSEMRTYYTAWAAFDRLCNSDEYTIQLTLQPGDCVVFDNARVMHGREEYPAGVPRHLQGCYIDHDAVRSTVASAAYERKYEDAHVSSSKGDASEQGGEASRRPLTPFDVHAEATSRVLEALGTQADFHYGEGLNMLEHALQAADCAKRGGASSDEVVAALCHDVGNTPQARDVWKAKTGDEPPMLYNPSNEPIGYASHAEIGGAYLRHIGFAESVCQGGPELHVSAKRALVTADPSYFERLSQASVDTLKHQGGPLTPTELEAFYEVPGSRIALQVRRYDDEAKVPGKKVPQLEAYREAIYQHLVAQSQA